MKWPTPSQISLIMSARCIQVLALSSFEKIPPKLCDLKKKECTREILFLPVLFSTSLFTYQPSGAKPRCPCFSDVFLLCSQSNSCLLWINRRELEGTVYNIHLKVAVGKCEVYSPSEISTLPVLSQIPNTTEGPMILGTPAG